MQKIVAEKIMIKNIAIVSLSSGIMGEPFIQFEVEIGLRRLKELVMPCHAALYPLESMQSLIRKSRLFDLLTDCQIPVCRVDMFPCCVTFTESS